jgi:hypothetical protein
MNPITFAFTTSLKLLGSLPLHMRTLLWSLAFVLPVSSLGLLIYLIRSRPQGTPSPAAPRSVGFNELFSAVVIAVSIMLMVIGFRSYEASKLAFSGEQQSLRSNACANPSSCAEGAEWTRR